VNEKLLKMLHFRQFITVSCCNCTADVAASISMDVSKRKRGERKKGGVHPLRLLDFARIQNWVSYIEIHFINF